LMSKWTSANSHVWHTKAFHEEENEITQNLA